jgi:hypothetical protein
VSRLPRQCGILNISQPCRPPRPVTGIVCLFFYLLQTRGWRVNFFLQNTAASSGFSILSHILPLPLLLTLEPTTEYIMDKLCQHISIDSLPHLPESHFWGFIWTEFVLLNRTGRLLVSGDLHNYYISELLCFWTSPIVQIICFRPQVRGGRQLLCWVQ